MTKSLFKTLSLNLAFTLLASSLLTFITYKLLSTRDTGSLEAKQADLVEAMAGIFWIVVLTVSSLTIYFNLNSIVRQKAILSFIAFFFLPILVTTLFRLAGDNDSEWLSFYIATAYFFITHFISYIIFLRQCKTSFGLPSN